MSSFLKSALQLHETQRPVLPVDGDIPRVPEEPWATTGPWQEAQHRTHTTATAPAAQLRAGRETHEDFPGFAAAHQTSKALAEHQSHLQLHRAVWKEMCVSGRGREGESGATFFYGLWKLIKPLVEFWGKVLRPPWSNPQAPGCRGCLLLPCCSSSFWWAQCFIALNVHQSKWEAVTGARDTGAINLKPLLPSASHAADTSPCFTE